MSSEITRCPNCGGEVEKLPAEVGFACLEPECGWTDLNLPVSIATDSGESHPQRQQQVPCHGEDDNEIIASDELIVFGNRVDAELIRWDLDFVGGFHGGHYYQYRSRGTRNWHVSIEARVESSDYQDIVALLEGYHSSCCLKLGWIRGPKRRWYLLDNAYFDIEDALSVPSISVPARRPSGSEWRDDGRLHLELNFIQYGGKVQYVEE